MKRIYATHDDAELYVGDPCRLDNGDFGQIAAVSIDEDYDPSTVDPDTNPMNIFIVYDYNRDEICACAAVTPLDYVLDEVPDNMADKIALSLAVKAIQTLMKDFPYDKVGVSWLRFKDKNRYYTVNDWIISITTTLTTLDQGATPKIQQSVILNIIYKLVMAYNRSLIDENRG